MVIRRLGALRVEWVQQDEASTLARVLPRKVLRMPAAPDEQLIEERARVTNAAGYRPAWEGYGKADAVRTSDQVRTDPVEGRFYSFLVIKLKSEVVVEFGTAFGVSGMYWLAGLEANQNGELFTFEPNEDWATLARPNLEAIGRRFTLTVGTFEDHAAAVLEDRVIDVAFIDAIHTSEFLEPQLDLVVARCRPGSIVVLDDIDFSDDMAACWARLSSQKRFRAAATVSRRVGVLEVA